MQFGVKQIAKFPPYSTDTAERYMKIQREALNLPRNNTEFITHANQG